MIKPVDEIPLSVAGQRKSYREKIRADIQEAIDKGIKKFEFEGDYNFKYLAQYAKEESARITDKVLRERFRPQYEDFKKEHGIEHLGWPHLYGGYARDEKGLKIYHIKIYCKKQPDRNHVYCEIFPDAVDKLIEIHKAKELEYEKRRRERPARKMMRPKQSGVKD